MTAALLAALLLPAADGARKDLYGDPLPPGAVARLGTIRLRHDGAEVEFTKDGKQLISCDCDGQVRTWDVNTGKLVRRQRLAGRPQESERFTAVTLSPGGLIAAGWDGKDGSPRLYDTSTTRERGQIPSIHLTDHRLTPKFLADSGFLTLSRIGDDKDYIAQIWDSTTIKQRQALATRPNIELASLAIAPFGDRLAAIARVRDSRKMSGHYHSELYLWDTVTGKWIGRKADLRGINEDSLTFSPDGKTLAVGGRGKAVVRLLAADTLREKLRLTPLAKEPQEYAGALVFSPDGRQLAAARGRIQPGMHGATFDIPCDVLLWDLSENKGTQRVLACRGWPRTFSFDGRILACGKGSEIRLYDTATGRPLHDRPGHGQTDLALAVSPDGKLLASAERDGILRLWDISTSKQVWASEAQRLFVTDCFFSADGRHIAAGNRGGPFFDFQVWDVTGGGKLGRISIHEDDGCLYAAALSADGQRFRGVYAGEVNHSPAELITWDAASGRRLSERPYRLRPREDTDGSSGDALAVFSADGEQLTVWQGDRLGIEEVSTERLLARLPKGLKRPSEFSPDGRFLLAMVSPAKADDDDAEGVEVQSVIETASGQEIARLELPAPNKIAFTPDGRGLLVSDRKNLRVRDMIGGEILHQMAWPDSIAREKDYWDRLYIPSVAPLPEGRVAASVSEGDILVWDLEYSTWPSRKPKRELDRATVEALWSDLDGDARKACRAIAQLTDAPAQAVAFFQEKLQPVTQDTRIVKLVADLDGDSYEARDKATRELKEQCSRAEPMLRAVLESRPSLEMRRRIEAILSEPQWAPPQSLRTLRAIAVLERIGTPEARRILEKLAGGAPSRETREVKASLERLRRSTH